MTADARGQDKHAATPADAATGPDAAADDFDADALVSRLRRNALWSLAVIAILVAVLWRQPMAVVGAVLGGALMLLNFHFLERLVSRLLGSSDPSPSPAQLGFLAIRLVLMALVLSGIVLLSGISPIPVALGLSILVLAVVVESLAGVFSGTRPGA